MSVKHCLVALAIGAAFAPAAALAQGPRFEASLADDGERWGGEVGIGYAVAAGPLILTPTFGALLYEGEENPRFREETIGGETVCRDLQTARLTSDQDCERGEAEGFARLEAGLSGRWGEIGGGARWSETTTIGYGRIGLYLGSFIMVNVTGGANYASLGVTFGGVRR